MHSPVDLPTQALSSNKAGWQVLKESQPPPCSLRLCSCRCPQRGHPGPEGGSSSHGPWVFMERGRRTLVLETRRCLRVMKSGESLGRIRARVCLVLMAMSAQRVPVPSLPPGTTTPGALRPTLSMTSDVSGSQVEGTPSHTSTPRGPCHPRVTDNGTNALGWDISTARKCWHCPESVPAAAAITQDMVPRQHADCLPGASPLHGVPGALGAPLPPPSFRGLAQSPPSFRNPS